MAESEGEIVSKRIAFLVDYEDEILSVSDQIDEFLQENLIDRTQFPKEDNLISSLKAVLGQSIADDDELEDVVIELSNALMRWSPEYSKKCAALAESEEFTTLLTNLANKYQQRILYIQVIQEQGDKFFANGEADVVSRSPYNALGLNHKISLGPEGETVEITTSLNSNLRVINYFLNQQLRTIEQVDNDLADEMDDDLIQSIHSLATNLKEVGLNG